MAESPSLIDQLVESLRCLPGVGPRSAQRMVMHLLERNRDGARQLASKLTETMDRIQNCRQCRNYTEQELCSVCSNPARQVELLCVVENPADLLAIEHTGNYRGKYFVLMGLLSPLDGIGPENLGLDELLEQCKGDVKEVILAVSSSVEGEATSHYISELLRSTGVAVSRIAQGIPLGGDLEYVDGGTLTHALNGRKIIE